MNGWLRLPGIKIKFVVDFGSKSPQPFLIHGGENETDLKQVTEINNALRQGSFCVASSRRVE